MATAPSVEQFPSFGSVSDVVAAYSAADVVTGNVNASVWRQFVRYAAAVYNHCRGATIEARTKELAAVFRTAETRLGSPLPAAYRSAKSTILAAISETVALLDSEDTPRPKSELSAAIALKRRTTTMHFDAAGIPAAPSDKNTRAVQAFERAAERLCRTPLTQAQGDAARVAAASVLSHVSGV